MSDLRKDIAAHEARAKRAEKNIAQGRADYAKNTDAEAKATDKVEKLRLHALAAKARWWIHHNIAVRNIERVRAARLRKKLPSGTPRQRAVRWALSRVGVVEHPPYSNSGPFISDWIRMGGGEPGYAWCQYFCNAGLKVGGGEQLMSGYTPEVVDWARQRIHGLKIVSFKQAEPGDFVYFKFPGVSSDPCDHVGMLISHGNGKVTCVEGNTSSGNSGSQNNGGGVFKRTRDAGLVAYIVRPTYAGE